MSSSEPFRLVLRDKHHNTYALTNGRVRLSIWAGELDKAELEALSAQLRRGAIQEGKNCADTE